MSETPVQLRVTPPDGWNAASLAPPDLTQAPQLSLEQWSGRTGGAREGTLVWGCVRGDVSQWSADATELAQSKLVELSASTLSRIGEGSLHVVRATTSQDGRVLEQTLASESPARARTFVAFTKSPEQAHACLVVCSEAERCGDAVDRASVEGAIVEPPSPGIALRALSAAVHHPHTAVGVVAAVIVLVAGLAVATRPKPLRPRRGAGKKPTAAKR